MRLRPDLVITNTCLRVGNRHFELKAIRQLEARQAARHPLTWHAAAYAAVLAVLILTFWRSLSPAGLAAAALLFAVLALTALIGSQHRPRRRELWADYRGIPTLLFASEDWWLFSALDRHLHRVLHEVRLGHLDMAANTDYRSRATSAIPHPSAVHPSTMTPASWR